MKEDEVRKDGRKEDVGRKEDEGKMRGRYNADRNEWDLWLSPPQIEPRHH
jgi:hypothetical protein